VRVQGAGCRVQGAGFNYFGLGCLGLRVLEFKVRELHEGLGKEFGV
jgi:hypothetical protein